MKNTILIYLGKKHFGKFFVFLKKDALVYINQVCRNSVII
jgi:hypothetical protein